MTLGGSIVEATWLRVLTDILIGVITIANAEAAIRLVADIISTTPFTNNATTLLAAGGAIWLTNVIAFALWYWDLDRGARQPVPTAPANPPLSSRR